MMCSIRFSSKAILIGLVTVVSLSINSVHAGEKVRWKLHSAFGTNLAVLGRVAPYIAETIHAVTDGDFDIRVFEPGALSGAYAYYDPLSQGAFDAAYGVPGVSAGKNPAYAFATTWPFGPGPTEFLAWYQFGGGGEIVAEIYARDNIKFMLCGLVPPESSGWFGKPIDTLDQLKGLKIRFFGMGAKVLQKFGASTQMLAAGDVYTALEIGTIDAAELSMPAIDRSLGFHQIVKYNYFPGWHQPTSAIELAVNMDKWNALPASYQTLLETTCQANISIMLADGEASQYDAMLANEADGVQNMTWSYDMLNAFKLAWEEVLAEEIAANEDVRRLWQSYTEFHEKYKIWGERGYLK